MFRRAPAGWELAGVACAGALLLFSLDAQAQSAAPGEAILTAVGYRDRPFHIELLAGVATKVGSFGIAGEYDFGDLLSAGVGIGSNFVGTEWEAHARWRIVSGENHRHRFYDALTLEGAFSRAPYEGFSFIPAVDCDTLNPNDGCYDPPVVAQTVSFGQLELGWEGMSRSGVTLRASTGLARELGTYHWTCRANGQSVPCGELPSSTLFVFTFALGYAF